MARLTRTMIGLLAAIGTYISPAPAAAYIYQELNGVTVTEATYVQQILDGNWYALRNPLGAGNVYSKVNWDYQSKTITSPSDWTIRGLLIHRYELQGPKNANGTYVYFMETHETQVRYLNGKLYVYLPYAQPSDPPIDDPNQRTYTGKVVVTVAASRTNDTSFSIGSGFGFSLTKKSSSSATTMAVVVWGMPYQQTRPVALRRDQFTGALVVEMGNDWISRKTLNGRSTIVTTTIGCQSGYESSWSSEHSDQNGGNKQSGASGKTCVLSRSAFEGDVSSRSNGLGLSGLLNIDTTRSPARPWVHFAVDLRWFTDVTSTPIQSFINENVQSLDKSMTAY
ncbi:MAG: hypothetical protein HYX75_08390 [Acidobacteria bacterium]|nr:hypothetical protein [Acidobacteriota bacterium]